LLRFVTTRLLNMVFVLVGVSLLTFLVGHLAPGDPILILLGNNKSPELYAQIKAAYGLDRPFIEQFAKFAWRALHGDFGLSYAQQGQAVTDILARGVPVSLQIGGLALLCTLAVAVPLGTIAAVRSNTWFDNLIVSIALALYAVPNFILAPLLLSVDIALYRRGLPSLPVAGWGTPAHLVLPVLVYTLGSSAYLVRLTRNSVLEVLREDYVRTARAKGLSNRAVNARHVVRNSLIPIVTYVGPSVAFLVSGSFVIEYMFAIPGIGYLAVQSLYQRDFPVVQGITVSLAAAVVIMNLITDISYAILDPRVRYG
jgi:ABC-type dipeptide/oligopeptide/nickel transport system permease component